MFNPTISASVAIDNDFTLWVNGSLVKNQSNEGCSFDWNYTVPIPDTLWLPGDNLIAVQARDRGFVTGFEFELTAPSSSLPSITKQLSLTMKIGATDGQGGVTMSPEGTLSNTIGQATTFTALVTDATGAPLPLVQRSTLLRSAALETNRGWPQNGVRVLRCGVQPAYGQASRFMG